jgi:hypothetical protein
MNFNKIALIVATCASLVMPDISAAFPRAAEAWPSPQAAQFSVEQIHVKKRVVVRAKKPIKRSVVRRVPTCSVVRCRPVVVYRPVYRPWRTNWYYGSVIAGVVLGTIIVVSARQVPRRPSNELCWYWSNNAQTRGYWDYCY